MASRNRLLLEFLVRNKGDRHFKHMSGFFISLKVIIAKRNQYTKTLRDTYSYYNAKYCKEAAYSNGAVLEPAAFLEPN